MIILPIVPRLNFCIQLNTICWCGSVEASLGVVPDLPFTWPLRAQQLSAAPFFFNYSNEERRNAKTSWAQRTKAKTTRSSLAFIPCGRFTSHVRWAASTCSSIVARAGGWSPGDSTKRKSGPICAMRKLAPFKSSRIRTNAECPP